MELAIPLLALGGFYVISNQNSTTTSDRVNTDNYKQRPPPPVVSKKLEPFVNMGLNQNSLPNTSVPPQNYPVMNNEQLTDTIQQYPNPNKETDKYFNQNF